MKQFLAVFLGSPSDSSGTKWNSLDEKTREGLIQEGMAAWGKWAQDNEKSIVSIGTPLGKTKRVDKQGISDIRNLMAAYTVVQAETHEAAAKIFLSHPHFMIFPGESIEIMECLPLPKS